MNAIKLYSTLGLILIFTSTFLLKDHLAGPLHQDEHHYLATAVFFSNEIFPSLKTLTSYEELNTAIPFMLGGWVIRIFGEDIQLLRILTYFTSFSLLMIFVWSSPCKNRQFWLYVLALMAFPNYYLCSVYYYTDIFAMIAVLAGIVFYVRKMHWASLLSFIFAISCRQYMLAFPAAIAAYEILQQPSWRFKAFFKLMLTNKTWIYYGLALFSILPWVLIWHGMAPAKVMSDQFYDSDKLISYRPGYILYSCACVAVYYVIPELLISQKFSYYITYTKERPLFFIGLLFVITGLVVVFPAKQAHNPYFTWAYLGYVDQFFVTIGFTGFIKQICFGLLALITCIRFAPHSLQLPGLLVLFNEILLGKAQVSWDKYLLPLILVLWFLTMFDEYWSKSKTNDSLQDSVSNSHNSKGNSADRNLSYGR